MRRTEDEETGKVSLRSTTVRAEDVSVMGEKAATYEGYSTLVAHETVTVPVSSLKRYKLGSAQTCNRPLTAAALLAKEVSEAVATEGFLVT